MYVAPAGTSLPGPFYEGTGSEHFGSPCSMGLFLQANRRRAAARPNRSTLEYWIVPENLNV